MSSAIAAPPQRSTLIPLAYLGLLAGVQGSDPNIASTALLSASNALHMGTLDAIAASISTLMLAATVITTGMMADRWGRKRVLIVALIVAIAGDLIVATAATPMIYIVGRAVAGVGLGAVFGASFAYIKTFAKPGGLASAIGVYVASTGVFALALTFAGSSLVGVDWRVAFMFIPAVAALSLVAGLFVLPRDEARSGEKSPWDALGQVLLAGGIVLSLYGISHATNGITSVLTIAPFVVGVALLGLWAWRQSTSPDRRFFPIALFREPVFIAAVLAGLLYNLSSGVMLLAFSNLFQYSLGVAGLALSLSQLPYLIAGIPAALVVGRLLGSGKLSRRAVLMLGAGIIIAGTVVFGLTAQTRPDNVWAFVPALMIVGIGVILPSVPYGSMILEAADQKHYGVVSSSRTTIGQYWYSLGLAGATIVLDGITRVGVRDKLGASAVTALDAYAASGTRPADASVLTVAAAAYVDAFAVLMYGLAAVIAVAAVAIFFLLRSRPATKLPADAPVTHPHHPVR